MQQFQNHPLSDRETSDREASDQETSHLRNQIAELVQPAIILSSETPIDQAIAAIGSASQNSLSFADCILVQSASGFVGMLSSQDIIRAAIAGVHSSRQTVADWMRSEVVCLKLSDLTDERILTQLRQGFTAQSCLPVLNDQGQAIGVLTAEAIVQMLLVRESAASEPSPQLPQAEPDSQSPAFEGQFQEMVARIPGLLYRYVIRPDGTDAFAYLSPGFRDLCGFEVEDAMQNPSLMWQRVHPDDIPQMEAAAAISAQSLTPWSCSYRITAPSGELKWLLATSRPHRGANGETVWDGLIVDITTSKQMEMALQASEDRYLMLAEGLSDIIYLVDGHSFQIIYINPAVEVIFGRSREFFIQDNPHSLTNCMHPDDRVATRQAFKQAIEEQQDGVELNYRILRPDGTIRCLRDRISFRRDTAGQITFYQGVASDITEMRQAEATLQQLNQELERRVQERTQAFLASQSALHQREQEFRSLAENSPDLILRLDRQMRYLYVNPMMEALMQRPAAEIVGKTSYDMGFPKELVDFWWAAYDRVYTTRQQQQIEFWVNTAKGEIYFQSKFVPEFNAAGEVVSFLVVSRDITELKQIQAELQQSESRFRQLAETVNDAFWLAEPLPNESRDLHYLYVNSAFARIWGRPLSLLYESGTLWFETIHPDDRDRVLDVLPQQLQENYDHEFRILRPNGEVRWVRDRTFPIYDESGSLYRIAGIVEDITERKQFEQQLQTAYRELEQRVEERTAELRAAKEAAEAASSAKSTFLANMSHELRTPLNAILGFTQLLSQDPGLTPAQYEQINIVNRSGEHLLHLINDILEMSKIEAGRTSLTPIAFDLHNLLHNLHELLHLRAATKGLELRFDLDSALPRYIDADEGKLRQVLINLLSNAIKFTAQGRVVLRVQSLRNTGGSTVSPGLKQPAQLLKSGNSLPSPESLPLSKEEPGSSAIGNPDAIEACSLFLRFQVEDTGCGIAPEEIGSLFEPFVQTQSGRTAPEGGTGLGLPISREFVRLMGGELTVHSMVDQGSVFTVDLPVTLAETPSPIAPFAVRQVIGLADHQPLYRILVVDDQDISRRLLITLLKRLGFAVAEARNGQEAIEQWQAWQPHLIWMDMRMPVMDGDEATRQIRVMEAEGVGNGEWRMGERGIGRGGDEEEQGSEEVKKSSNEEVNNPSAPPPHLHAPLPTPHSPTKIIALTASAFEEDREKMLAIGCDDFVPKPFNQEMLLKKLAEHLGVEYVYVDAIGKRSALEQSDLEPVPMPQVMPEQLQVMSSAWIDQLYQFCLQLNSSAVLTLIDQIPADHQTLAKALTAKVNEFQFEEVMHLAEVARSSRK